MSIPNLAGSINKADVEQKGSGSYAASYVNWARVAHILHTEAPGWEFHLRPAADGGLVWAAPDGTAFVIGFFSGPDGEATADVPFSCMDNRNQSIPMEKVSARVLTDTHRRALCLTAAYTMGLAYELWAKEEVENPYREDKAAPKADKPLAKDPTPKQAPAKTPTAAPAKAEAFVPAPADSIKAVQARILQHPNREQVIEAFKQHKGLLPAAKKVADHIQTPADVAFLNDLCDSLGG